MLKSNDYCRTAWFGPMGLNSDQAVKHEQAMQPFKDAKILLLFAQNHSSRIRVLLGSNKQLHDEFLSYLANKNEPSWLREMLSEIKGCVK